MKNTTEQKILHNGIEIDIFVKFGYDNLDKNYYEFYRVNQIWVDNDRLWIHYFGKRMNTWNTVSFPNENTHFGIKSGYPEIISLEDCIENSPKKDTE